LAKKSIVTVWLGSVPLLGNGSNCLKLDITRTQGHHIWQSVLCF